MNRIQAGWREYAKDMPAAENDGMVRFLEGVQKLAFMAGATITLYEISQGCTVLKLKNEIEEFGRGGA